MTGSYLVEDPYLSLKMKLGAVAGGAALALIEFVMNSQIFQTLTQNHPTLKFLDQSAINELQRGARNDYMARTLLSAFQENPSDIMLAIVGRGHVFDEARPSRTLPSILKDAGWNEIMIAP